MKTAVPAMNKFLRPNMSPSLAYMRSVGAKLIRNPVPSHDESLRWPNSDDIVGTAVATILESSAVSSIPMFSLS